MSKSSLGTGTSTLEAADYRLYRSLNRLRRRSPDDWRLTEHHEFLLEWDQLRQQHGDVYRQLQQQYFIETLETLLRQARSALLRLLTNIVVAIMFLALLGSVMYAVVAVLGG